MPKKAGNDDTWWQQFNLKIRSFFGRIVNPKLCCYNPLHKAVFPHLDGLTNRRCGDLNIFT